MTAAPNCVEFEIYQQEADPYRSPYIPSKRSPWYAAPRRTGALPLLMRDRDERTPFADQLRRHRLAAGFSQRELARRAGYSLDYVGMLERGVRSPSLASLGPLADALELTDSARLEIQRAVWPDAPEALAAAPAVAGELVGRAAECAAIEAFLTGQSAALVLLGELGIGKTRLLQEAQWLASRRGQAVLFGGTRPAPSGALRPYEPLLTALSELVRSLPARRLRAALRGTEWLVALLPELRERGFDLTRQQVPHVLQRRSVLRAIRRFLTQVSGGQPVLLTLDDLQWASPEALDALQFVLAPPLRIRLIGACRAGEVRPDQPLAVLWSELLQQDALQLVLLEPLGVGASRELLCKLLTETGRFDARLLAEAVRRCEGVPLFLHAFARALRARADPSAVPHDLSIILRQYVATRPAAAQEVLAALAAGNSDSASISALSAATQLACAQVQSVLHELAHQMVVMLGGDGKYHFRHDVMREAVANDLTPGGLVRERMGAPG